MNKSSIIFINKKKEEVTDSACWSDTLTGFWWYSKDVSSLA